MKESLFKEADFLKKIFDVIPSILLIVDADVRIHNLNLTASNKLGLDIKDVYEKRSGEVLHCINSLVDGCGMSGFCKDCIIRNAVTKAMRGGGTYRERMLMEIRKDNKTMDMHLLVTSSPFEYDQNKYALLILEDISELVQLRSFLPICACCKKIRNDEHYWEDMENYFSTHNDIQFSHGICPECARKLYPEQFKK
jgi:hypothetical protein